MFYSFIPVLVVWWHTRVPISQWREVLRVAVCKPIKYSNVGTNSADKPACSIMHNIH